MTSGCGNSACSAQPVLDAGKAREIVGLAIQALQQPENAQTLKSIIAECDQQASNPMLQFQLKMGKLVPKVLEILGAQIQGVLGKPVESGQVMLYVGQIQTLAATDVHLGIQVGKILKTLGGDFSGLEEEDDEEVETAE